MFQFIPFATPWPSPAISGFVTTLATASRRITNEDYKCLALLKGIPEAPRDQRKRLDGIQADIKDVRAELGRTKENVAAIARTQVTMQRDICTIQRDLGELKDRITF
jgi:septal ring factor EnvC (AmiA/AmiB activator)